MALQKLLSIAIIAVFAVFIIGIAGYTLIEGWHIIDSMYMTVITIAGVGFGEVHPLTPAGQLFTIFIILSGVGSVVFTLTVGVAFIVEGTLTNLIRDRRMQKIIDKLENHFIICGSDGTARSVIEEFTRVKLDFVTIVNNQAELDRLLALYPDICFLQGDATEDNVLLSAGVKRARGLVAALPDDKDNLFVVLSARELNSSLRIVGKAMEEDTRYKILKVGANSVVSPTTIGGLRMASEMIRPDVVGFLDNMMRDQEMTLRVEEATICKDCQFDGQSIREADIGKKTGVIIIAIKDSESQKYVYNPDPDTKLKCDDILLMIGNTDQVKKLRRLSQKAGMVMGPDKVPAPLDDTGAGSMV